MYTEYNIPEEIEEIIVKMNPTLLAVLPIGKKLLIPEERRKLMKKLTVRSVLPNGVQRCCINGRLHDEDGPALIYPDGRQEWYLNGRLRRKNRENGPTLIYPDGRQEWRIDGRLHRIDGPAIIYPDGRQEWRIDGHLRISGGPAIIFPDGSQFWCLDHCIRRVEGKQE